MCPLNIPPLELTLLSGDHSRPLYIFSKKKKKTQKKSHLSLSPLLSQSVPTRLFCLSMEIMLIKHAHDLHIAKPYGCFLLFIVLTSTVASDPTDHTSPLKGCPTMVPAPPYSPNIFHLTLASPPWGLLFGSPFP